MPGGGLRRTGKRAQSRAQNPEKSHGNEDQDERRLSLCERELLLRGRFGPTLLLR
jgi:hypothetical protein